MRTPPRLFYDFCLDDTSSQIKRQTFRETVERHVAAPISDSQVNGNNQATPPLPARSDCASDAVTQKRLMCRGRQAVRQEPFERVQVRGLAALRRLYAFPLETISKPDVGRRYEAGAQGGGHARSCVRRARICAHRADGALRRRLAAPLGVQTMTEPTIGLAVAVMLGLYLLYTLIRPEKF